MRTSRTVCKMAMAMLAAVTVTMMGTGCGEQEAGPATTQVETTPPVEKPTPAAVTPASEATRAFDAFASKAGVPVARVPVVANAPKVDGVMDKVYEKATPLNFGFLIGGDEKPTAATTVYVVSTDKTLYIFFNCQSPDMDALLADIREHDGPVWNDDSIEIFIDPTNKRQIDGYMHLGVNAIGTTMESKGPKGDEDYSWDPKMTVKTKVGKKAWTVELAIPFSELVSNPARMNRVWAVNFNRMAYLIEGNEDTAWSATGGTDSHVPSKFGALWLDAGKVDNTK